jgi:hypothetical protein
MTHKIFSLSDIDFNFSYDGPYEVLHNDKKKKIIYMKTDDKPILIQLPSLLLNNDYVDGACELILPLVTKNNLLNSELKKMLQTLDETVLKTIKTNLKQWNLKFTKPTYRSIVSTVENESDDTYANGIIRLSFSKNITKIFNYHKKQITEEKYKSHLTKGCYVRTIIEIAGILIDGDNIMVNIIVHQLGVTYVIPEQVVLIEYSFADSDDEKEHESPEIQSDAITFLNTDDKSSAKDDDKSNDKIKSLHMLDSGSDSDGLNDMDDKNDTDE